MSKPVSGPIRAPQIAIITKPRVDNLQASDHRKAAHQCPMKISQKQSRDSLKLVDNKFVQWISKPNFPSNLNFFVSKRIVFQKL